MTVKLLCWTVAVLLCATRAHACSYDKADDFSERMRGATHVFIAQIDRVAFHAVEGMDERATSLIMSTNKGAPRSIWWDAQASRIQNVRGKVPDALKLRFDGNRCGGARLFPGNWYLFAVSDIGQELVITPRAVEAIREMRWIDGVANAKELEELKTRVLAALADPRPTSLDAIERTSDGISAIGPPPLPPPKGS